MKETDPMICSPETDTLGKEGFDKSCRFIDVLVRARHLNGVSSGIMELTLAKVTTALGLKGEFVTTPNYVQSVLRDEDGRQQRVNLSVSRNNNIRGIDLKKIDFGKGEIRYIRLDPEKRQDYDHLNIQWKQGRRTHRDGPVGKGRDEIELRILPGTW